MTPSHFDKYKTLESINRRRVDKREDRLGDYGRGLVILIGALGLFCTMVATDVGQLQSWQSATAPPFVAKLLGYLGAVIAAFVAGKITPPAGRY